MATKQPEIMESPVLASSSEEEEESGSSGEESESSGENSNKEESSDDEVDDQSKPIQTISASVAPEKLESDSEGESDSDSDPEPESAEEKLTQNKARPETSGSAVNLPESSTAKRPSNQADGEAKKKMKTSTTDEEVRKISGEEAKKMFQRLFSETDEIALLQGILDYAGDISNGMDAFCEYAVKLIDFNASRNQIATKIQRLKKKYLNTVKNSLKRGKGEDQIRFSKDLDQKSFELSRKIWGSEGFMASKSRKRLGVGGTPKEIKLVHSSKKQEEMEIPMATVVNSHLSSSSSSREIARFFKSENASVFGLDESTVTAGWDMVADGPKKREMEERWKKLKTKKVELCLQRTALVDNAAKMIFKDNASSSC